MRIGQYHRPFRHQRLHLRQGGHRALARGEEILNACQNGDVLVQFASK